MVAFGISGRSGELEQPETETHIPGREIRAWIDNADDGGGATLRQKSIGYPEPEGRCSSGGYAARMLVSAVTRR